MAEKKFDFLKFLNNIATFNGQNISEDARKLCTVARAIVEQPKLVLLCEQALDFGNGTVENFKTLSKYLPQSTIISITHKTDNIFAYNRVMLLDNGSVIEKGEPKALLASSNSYLLSFMKETDKKSLKQQLNLLGVSQTMPNRISSASRFDHEDMSLKPADHRRTNSPRQPSMFRPREKQLLETPINSKDSQRMNSGYTSPFKAAVSQKKKAQTYIVQKRSVSEQRPGPQDPDIGEMLNEMASADPIHRANEIPTRVMGNLQYPNKNLFSRSILTRQNEEAGAR